MLTYSIGTNRNTNLFVTLSLFLGSSEAALVADESVDAGPVAVLHAAAAGDAALLPHYPLTPERTRLLTQEVKEMGALRRWDLRIVVNIENM